MLPGAGPRTRFGNLPNEPPALLMFRQHHADRPALAGNPTRFQFGEKQVLLLAMMTSIRKKPEERDELSERLNILRAHGRALVQNAL